MTKSPGLFWSLTAAWHSSSALARVAVPEASLQTYGVTGDQGPACYHTVQVCLRPGADSQEACEAFLLCGGDFQGVDRSLRDKSTGGLVKAALDADVARPSYRKTPVAER